jgi:hypothetical protein
MISHSFFYSATISSRISQLILLLTPLSPRFFSILCVPNLALESAMACRVFRGLRIGLIEDSAAPPSSIRCRTANTKEYAIKTHDLVSARAGHISVQISEATKCGGPVVSAEKYIGPQGETEEAMGNKKMAV